MNMPHNESISRLSEETNKLFDQRIVLLEKKIVEHPLEILLWEATRTCNLRCTHCGVDGIDIMYQIRE